MWAMESSTLSMWAMESSTLSIATNSLHVELWAAAPGNHLP